jgi:TRAP transporter TAXI family solute receptor
MKAEYITFTDAADMLQNGSIDGAWIMSGAPASAVAQALTAKCHLIGISDDLIAKLQAKYPWYAKYTIPAGTYPNQDQPVNTSAIKMVMFCRGDLNEDLVYKMTKAFWENIDQLGKSQKNLKGLKPADAVKDIANVPLHPGAIKYYKEIGVLK